MDIDEKRLLAHIKMCHRIIAQLTGIIEGLWEVIQLDNPGVINSPESVRLEKLLTTIRRATGPSEEH